MDVNELQSLKVKELTKLAKDLKIEKHFRVKQTGNGRTDLKS